MSNIRPESRQPTRAGSLMVSNPEKHLGGFLKGLGTQERRPWLHSSASPFKIRKWQLPSVTGEDSGLWNQEATTFVGGSTADDISTQVPATTWLPAWQVALSLAAPSPPPAALVRNVLLLSSPKSGQQGLPLHQGQPLEASGAGRIAVASSCLLFPLGAVNELHWRSHFSF